MIFRALLDLISGRKRCAYIKIQRNSITVRDVYTGQSCTDSPSSPFTSHRLLVGDFVVASKLLEALINRLYGNPVIPIRVPSVVHQLEMTDGGLSAVEHRVLLELADTASCDVALIHIGAELSDQQVLEIARRKPSARGA
jgi:hypothetical protein